MCNYGVMRCLLYYIFLHLAVTNGFRGDNALHKQHMTDSLYQRIEAQFDLHLDEVDKFVEGGQTLIGYTDRLPTHRNSFESAIKGTFPVDDRGKLLVPKRDKDVSQFSETSNTVVRHSFYDKRELVTGYRGSPYENPDDNYEPNNNVKNGAAFTQMDFENSTDYYTESLVTPILLFCLGFVSLFFFNVALCCRCCCKCCQCKPNDHHTEKGHEGDSHETREKYINHQKRMILLIEITLIFAVFLADTLCFYGYTHLESGVKKLNEAFELLLKVMNSIHDEITALKDTDAPNMAASNALAKKSCLGGSAANALAQIDTLTDSLQTASDSAYEYIDLYTGYVKIGRSYVNDYAEAYLRPAVFVIWSFAALSTFLFVLFRVCSNECGTKLAIFWGEITFIIILAINLPLMLLTSVVGDICMQPTATLLRSFNGTGFDSLVYSITHCDGSFNMKEKLLAANDSIQDIAFWVNQLNNICGSDTNVAAVETSMSSAGNRVGRVGNALACENLQEVWFKLMNEALCGGFYDGIYSLWVSQFITSFFLFFLIICASISYQYFKPNSQIVVDNEQIPGAEAEAIVEGEKVVDKSQDPGMGMSEFDGDYGDFGDGGGGGDVEMTSQEGVPIAEANDAEII